MAQGKIVGSDVREAGSDITRTIAESLEAAARMAGVRDREVKRAAASGYGAGLVSDARLIVSEASCLAKSAFQLDKNIRAVVDIGGLFITAVEINDRGGPGNSYENEKCAAGSGKFLETIAEAMDVPLNSVSVCAGQTSDPLLLTSGCAVFAESEVITQINSGRPRPDILSGVLHAIAAKASTLAGRIEASEGIALAGGVAKIAVIAQMVRKISGKSLIPFPLDLQLAVAHGAALFAEEYRGKGLARRVCGR